MSAQRAERAFADAPEALDDVGTDVAGTVRTAAIEGAAPRKLSWTSRDLAPASVSDGQRFDRRPLDRLLQGPHLWRGDGRAEVSIPSVPTGHAALDAVLPGNGWPRGALTELLVDAAAGAELALLAPALAQLSQDTRWIALVAPPHVPYGPAFAQAGIDPTRLLIVRPNDSADALWAMEQAAAGGACSAVLGWPAFVTERSLRRLQLAAETGRTCSFHCLAGPGAGSSLATLRLRFVRSPDRRDTSGAPRLGVHVLKVRGAGLGRTLWLDRLHDAPRPDTARDALGETTVDPRSVRPRRTDVAAGVAAAQRAAA